jgi:hypothetical protein
VKYVNPGMPQLFEYQTLNKLSVGIEDEFEHSRTGYYVDLSSNDSDVFYKMLNNVKEFYILFDLMIGKDVDSTNVISNWVKVFDFYNDNDTSKQKLMCNIHTRYGWVLDEMIWTFEQLCDEDWEQQYWITNPEFDLSEYPEDEGKKIIPVRWKVKGKCDWEGRSKHEERIDNGLRLFGKYYQTLCY